MNRRDFLSLASSSVAGAGLRADGRPVERGGFHLERRGGRWRLTTPAGDPFFSIGLNHIDDAPLRYPENGDLWHRKYGNSRERWLKEAVGPDLRAWGFNTVGWTQEVVVRGASLHRHSPSFTFEEYQWLGLPYCHLLPFAELHQWDAETRYPPFFASEFEDWCDYVARSQCGRFAGDPKLIGYFYTDCPTWVHVRENGAWKGPIFDPALLETDAGRAELRRLATRYYQVTRDAVRRYDANHLILGDRYEANAPLPMEVVESALPFVDVLSFQDFKDPVGHLKAWHERTGKPVLWADGARNIRGRDPVTGADKPARDGAWYGEALRGLRDNPGCVGAHLCGAYLRNRVRNHGLRDADETPDEPAIAALAAANRETAAWMSRQS